MTGKGKEKKGKEGKGKKGKEKEKRRKEKKFCCTLMGTFIAVFLFSNIS